MQAFDYLAPRSLDEAYSHLGNGKSSLFLAGGTDVIVQLREGRKHCDQLIDLKHIPELVAHGFTADGTLEIGAAAPLAEIYEDPEVASGLPGLIDAAALIGGIQIQSRASLGGNLCNASPAADSTPALFALGARLLIGSKAGTREIPVEEFFAGPGRSTLAANEILLQVRIPAQPARSGTFYLRFIPRNEMDIAVASAGARIVLSADGETIESARISLGAVGPTVVSANDAAASLAGQPATDASIQAAGDLASQVATPITDMRGSIAQRKKLAAVLTVRALQGALTRARENR
jgi:CO/xanthine dehydrogenase FAD-binding subunit